jgi:hypothetical protein|tara:strand:+ start:2648 stop:3364 length:717 start_codon:yes stop_codon:yes gene_type:complete
LKYTSTLPIFIGYEEREHEAYEVCKYSLEYQNQCRKETGTWAWDDYPDIIQLRSTEIKEYKRDHGEPQSTDFTFTRFWCPYLCDFEGFSLFVDCDFLFLAHPIEILKHIDTRKAVSVVQHPEYLPKGDIKMDGIAQHRSKRKNWASLILFNNEHPSNKILEPDYLNNHLPGLDFHHLAWLDDSEIGSIPMEWNCLDQYYHMENPKAIHYTEGGPWFGGEYYHTRYAQEWVKYKFKMNS